MTATWLVFALVLILFGARAWVVETSRGRFTTGGGAQRGLTAAVAASLVLLVGMATFNGGLELLTLLSDAQAKKTAQQANVAPGAGDQAGQPAAPGAADPNAVAPGAADPNAAVPGADPNAPAGGAAPAPANP